MSEFINVTEDVTIIETDDDHVEVVEAGVPGPQGPPGDPATNLVTRVAGKQGDVTLVKADVGLDLVDNTTDANKPVSTAQQNALNAKMDFPSSNARVPVRGASNNQASIPYAEGPTAGSFPLRTSDGQVRTSPATLTDAAVPKAQMDAADALKFDKTGGQISGQTTIRVDTTVNSAPQLVLENGSATAYAPAALALRHATAGYVMGRIESNPGTLYNAPVTRIWSADASRVLQMRMSFLTNGAIAFGPETAIQYVSGAGFPNGVVTAPVGSIYIDTAVTNGASSWIKASGTGNTGWVVENGDTGWREVSTLVGADVTSSLLQVRRADNVVYWQGGISAVSTGTTKSIFSQAVSNASFAGFRHSRQYPAVVPFAQGSWGAMSATYGRCGPGASGGDGWVFTATSTSLVNIQTAYPVLDSWPTTLPGTAA